MPGPYPSFGDARVAAVGTFPAWRRPPYPGDEMPVRRRQYAADILSHLTDRAVLLSASTLVHRMMSVPGLADETEVRLYAWEYICRTTPVRYFPYLALGWLGPDVLRARTGASWDGVLREGFITAVLQSVSDDFGVDWRTPRRYSGGPGYGGPLFRAPEPGSPARSTPWGRLVPAPRGSGGAFY